MNRIVLIFVVGATIVGCPNAPVPFDSPRHSTPNPEQDGPTPKPPEKDLFDILGYGADGFNDQGIDLNGYGRDEIHVETKLTRFGFNFLGKSRGMMHGAETIDGQAISYGFYGLDQMGFRRPLPNTPHLGDVTQDWVTRFDRFGYNRNPLTGEQRNYLGITKQDFKQHGYDAIVINGFVTQEGNELVKLFSRLGWQLFDHINAKPIQSFKDLLDAVRESEDFKNITEAQLTGFLKKSIWFYQYFLLAGQTDDAAIAELNRPLASLKVSRGDIIRDKLLDIDYGRLYKEWQRVKPLDVKAVIEKHLGDDSVLALAAFEEGDGTESIDDKRTALRDPVDTFLNADHGGNARYRLYKIAESLQTKQFDKPFLALAASKLMHGKLCIDARRRAVGAAYQILVPDDLARMNLLIARTQGDGLQSQFYATLTAIRREKYAGWIEDEFRKYLKAKPDIDQITKFAHMWDHYSDQVGLVGMDPGFADYDAPPHQLNDFFSDYTPAVIHKTLGESAVIDEIRRRILGPLIFVTTETPDKGFSYIKGLSLRLSAFE